MEIENKVEERVSGFIGQKSSAPHALLQSSECERIHNFITRRGRLRKIWGGTLYAESALGLNQIKWIDRYQNRWIAQHGRTIVVETAENSQTFTPAAGTGGVVLGDDTYVSSDRWTDRLYVTNGVENKFLENTFLGEKFLQLGIIPPGNGRKWVAFQADYTITESAAGGSGLPTGSIGYAITWWDSVRKVESLPWGAQVGEDGLWNSYAYNFASSLAVTPSGAGKKFRIDISAIKAQGYDTERVTHFKIYRWTQADNATFKLIADPEESGYDALLAISNDYYDDELPEASLGAVLDESISPPPSGKFYQGYGIDDRDVADIGPRFVKLHRDQLWLFGIRLPGTPYGSKPAGSSGYAQADYFPQSGILYGSDVGNFDYWKYSYDVGRANGQKDTGIARHRNTLILFKERSAFYLDGSSPDNYEIRELDVQRGVIAPGSIQETTRGVIGLSADGFCLFDAAGGGKIISEEITDEVERINHEYLAKITSAFDPEEEKYECHVPVENTFNTKVFVYDLKSGSWSFHRKAGGAIKYALDSKSRVVGLLGDARNGRLYKVTDRSATTMNSETLHGSWASKHFDFGRPGELKSLQRVSITARAKSDFRLSIDVIGDFGQRDSVTINDIEPDVLSGNWAEDSDDEEGMNWNEGQWASSTVKKRFTVLVQMIAENIQLVVRNSDTDADRASFEIEEILLEASALSGSDDN